MTAVDALGIRQAAARAALAVSGVAALEPTLGRRLAEAAARISRTAGATGPAAAGGVHAHPTGSGGWDVEVRCVLHGDRRALDVARDVHDQVRAAITGCAGRQEPPGTTRITVTITRITGPVAGTRPDGTVAGSAGSGRT